MHSQRRDQRFFDQWSPDLRQQALCSIVCVHFNGFTKLDVQSLKKATTPQQSTPDTIKARKGILQSDLPLFLFSSSDYDTHLKKAQPSPNDVSDAAGGYHLEIYADADSRADAGEPVSFIP